MLLFLRSLKEQESNFGGVVNDCGVHRPSKGALPLQASPWFVLSLPFHNARLRHLSFSVASVLPNADRGAGTPRFGGSTCKTFRERERAMVEVVSSPPSRPSGPD